MSRIAGKPTPQVAAVNEGQLISSVDYIAVDRKGQELVAAHGPAGAALYAGRIALEAKADGNDGAFGFWRTVELRLTPPKLGGRLR